MIYVINTGTSSNKGDGDTLRSAFNKINQNFQFLSTFTGAVLDRDLVPAVNNTYTLGSSSTVWKSLYLGTQGVSINGNVLTVNEDGNLTVNGSAVGTGTGVVSVLSFGPIVATTPSEIIDQSRSLNFGTITNPGSLAYSAGTII